MSYCGSENTLDLLSRSPYSWTMPQFTEQTSQKEQLWRTTFSSFLTLLIDQTLTESNFYGERPRPLTTDSLTSGEPMGTGTGIKLRQWGNPLRRFQLSLQRDVQTKVGTILQMLNPSLWQTGLGSQLQEWATQWWYIGSRTRSWLRTMLRQKKDKTLTKRKHKWKPDALFEISLSFNMFRLQNNLF